MTRSHTRSSAGRVPNAVAQISRRCSIGFAVSSLRRLLAQTAMFLALFVGFALGAFAGSGALGGPHSPQAARAVGDPELVDFRSSAASFLGGALPFESESESECEGTDQADGDDDATAGDASAPLSSFALAVRTL